MWSSNSGRGQDLLHAVSEMTNRVFLTTSHQFPQLETQNFGKSFKRNHGTFSQENTPEEDKWSLPSSYANNPGQQQILSPLSPPETPRQKPPGCRRSQLIMWEEQPIRSRVAQISEAKYTG